MLAWLHCVYVFVMTWFALQTGSHELAACGSSVPSVGNLQGFFAVDSQHGFLFSFLSVAPIAGAVCNPCNDSHRGLDGLPLIQLSLKLLFPYLQ